jgi:hypothetical protein
MTVPPGLLCRMAAIQSIDCTFLRLQVRIGDALHAMPVDGLLK